MPIFGTPAISPRDLIPFRRTARDYEETERLKSVMGRLFQARQPFFLATPDLELVFRWKLGRQLGRVERLLRRNSDQEYRAVTAAAFSIQRPEITDEAARRLRLLTCLDGVGVPIASAVLALVEPARYCVIDFRAWIALYCVDQRSFSIAHYQKYLMDVTLFSIELGWLVQETDLALWAFYEHHALNGPVDK